MEAARGMGTCLMQLFYVDCVIVTGYNYSNTDGNRDGEKLLQKRKSG